MSFILRLFSIVGLLFIFSCEEDVEEVTISDYHLFTATFEEGELDDDVTSFIFISDGEGKILADSSFAGAASIELFADTNGSPPPDKIGVTYLTKRYGQDFDIRTNLGVNKGSDWTWYHPYYEPEVIGQSYYMFTNLPDNLDEVIISSNGHRRNIDTSEVSIGGIWPISHYEPIEDVLIFATLNNDSAIYTFVNDVSAGDTSLLDFASFSGANQKIINNNSDLDIRGFWLYGFDLNDSFIPYKRHRLGGGYSNSNGDLVYPYPSELEKFISWLWGGDSRGTAGGKQWSQRIAGEIPVSFEKIDADISVINSNINNFEVNLNGSFDQWYMFLELNDTEISGQWTVYANPSIDRGSLPLFPESISNVYPELLRENFTMTQVAATDFLCVENQEEWFDLYFNTANGYFLDFCSGDLHFDHWLE